MLADWLFVIILLAGVSIATYTDLKNRWVPDYVNFVLITIGLLGHLIISILSQSYWPFVWSATGAGVFFLFGAALYYTGVWGGGDTKLLIGVGALLPFAPIGSLVPWPFLATILFNILLFGTLFGILGGMWLVIKNWNKVKSEIKKTIGTWRYGMYSLYGLLAVAIAFLFYFETNLLLFLWAVATLLFYLAVLLKSVENKCMFKDINPKKLVEGDWVLDIYHKGKKLYTQQKTGISKSAINRLLNLYKQGKIKNVTVKEGLPYVPAFLAAILTSVFYGDLLFQLFLALV